MLQFHTEVEELGSLMQVIFLDRVSKKHLLLGELTLMTLNVSGITLIYTIYFLISDSFEEFKLRATSLWKQVKLRIRNETKIRFRIGNCAYKRRKNQRKVTIITFDFF
jgi:hypothetical protein